MNIIEDVINEKLYIEPSMKCWRHNINASKAQNFKLIVIVHTTNENIQEFFKNMVK
jgi:hypothetical protein